MKRERLLFRSAEYLVLLLAAVLVISTTSAHALALTNPVIGWGGPVYEGWYTEYTFNAEEIDGPLKAFCVDSSAAIPVGAEYELIAVPDQEKLNLAAKFADYFFTNGGDQSDYQVAIWEVLDIKNYTTGSGWTGVDAILAGLSNNFWDSYDKVGSIALAHSPIGGEIPGGPSQDYLIAAPVPEPATMLLLGTGLIGLAGVSRKKFKK